MKNWFRRITSESVDRQKAMASERFSRVITPLVLPRDLLKHQQISHRRKLPHNSSDGRQNTCDSRKNQEVTTLLLVWSQVTISQEEELVMNRCEKG